MTQIPIDIDQKNDGNIKCSEISNSATDSVEKKEVEEVKEQQIVDIHREVQQQINQHKAEDDLKDEELARKLQAELTQQEREEKEKMEKSELMDNMLAMKMQLEEEQEQMKRERERIESEKAAIALENEQLRELKQEEEERKQKVEEQKKKDEELAQSLMEKAEEWVRQEFHRTVKGPVRQIISVENVSNGVNDGIYEKILEEKLKNGQPRNDVERYLWHGTKQLANLNLIIKNGFDRSYNTTSAYGKGTYFARDAAYSVNGFCGRDRNGVYSILLCKVIVGEFTVGSQGMTTIPLKGDGTEYDSLVNDMRKPQIFVIWRDYHACPAFLVQFK